MIGILDHSDLQCCGKQMTVVSNNKGYLCTVCRWVVTQIEFLRNSHGPQQARRARIANKEVGRTLYEAAFPHKVVDRAAA